MWRHTIGECAFQSKREEYIDILVHIAKLRNEMEMKKDFKSEIVVFCIFLIKFASSTLNSELEKGKGRCFY